MLPIGPGIAHANTSVGITLTKSAPATVYTNDSVFSYTVGIENPSGYTIAGFSIITDTVIAGQDLLGGTATSPWWYQDSDGRPTYSISTGSSDNRTSIPAGGATIGLGSPIADRTILTHTILCFDGTVNGASQQFCELVPVVTTEVRSPAFSFDQSPSEVCAGDTITYTLSVSNTGGAATTQMFTMTAQLDPRVMYVGGSASGGGIISGDTITWQVSSILLAGGANTITRTYAVTVPGTLSSDSYVTQTYAVRSPEVTPDGGEAWGTRVRKVSAEFEDSSPVCLGSTVYFTDTVSDVAPTARTWVFGDGSAPVTGNVATVNHLYANAGSYVVSLAVTGTCETVLQTDYYTSVVEVQDLEVSFTTDSPVCVWDTMHFTDTSVITSEVVAAYLWDFGDSSTSTTTGSVSHTYGTAGTYTVTLTVTTSAGCPETYTDTVSVEDVDVSFQAAPNPVCVLNTVFFTDTSSVSGSATYFWDFGDGATASVSRTSHIYSTAQSYTVTLTVTTSVGCVGSRSSVISVEGVDAAFTMAPNPVCELDTVYFTSTSVITSPSASYLWDFGDGQTSVYSRTSHLYSSASTYSVTLWVTTAIGCVDSASDSIQVAATPVPTFTSGSPVCATYPMTFANHTAGTLSGVLWNFGDSSTSSVENPTHSYATSGTYTVTLTVTDTIGCSGSTQGQVEVLDVPEPAFSYSTPSCVGSVVTFTNETPGSYTSLLWDFGDSGTSTATDPTHTFGTTGTFSVTLTVTNAGGCVGSLTHPVIIGSMPSASFTSNEPVCLGDTMVFTNTTSGSNFYNWNFDDGQTSIDTNPTNLYASAGSYTVVMTATDMGGCGQSVTQTVVAVNVSPEPQIFYSPTLIHAGDVVTFTDVGTGGAAWAWSFGDGSVAAGSPVTHTYASANDYTVVLTSTNGGCSSVTQTVVSVLPPSEETHVYLPIVFKNYSSGGGPDLIVASNISVSPASPWAGRPPRFR